MGCGCQCRQGWLLHVLARLARARHVLEVEKEAMRLKGMLAEAQSAWERGVQLKSRGRSMSKQHASDARAESLETERDA